MTTPLKPITPAELLAAAARLTFRPTGRDRGGATLGVLVDVGGAQHHLSIAPEEGADGRWTLSSAPAAGRPPFLVYESAANVMRGGHLGEDGCISYAGGSYVIESSFNGDAWTAKVSGSV